MGLFCALMALAAFGAAVPLGALPAVLRIGGFHLLDGIAFGMLLAGVTRTRRPVVIYALLIAATLTFWPFYSGWPAEQSEGVAIPMARQELVHNYIDILRIVLFLLGIPYPFARLGFHAPDVNAPGAEIHRNDSAPDSEIKRADST